LYSPQADFPIARYLQYSIAVALKSNLWRGRLLIWNSERKTEKREKDTMALLNDKQKKAFTKIIEKRHNQMRERMKERRRQF